jgi:putative NADH-flavin reductase
MKIIIFGANGKTGLLLIEQALAGNHEVVAYVRKAGSIKIDHPGFKIVVGNLNETLKIRDAMEGADACFSTLGGSSLKQHATEVMTGIENLISIMEELKIHRFIYLSSIGVGESKFMIPQPLRFYIVNLLLRVPMADHNVNEQNITKSNLQWTIVRPGGLTDGPLTGKYTAGIEKTKLKGNPTISRANVASFMLKQMTDDTYLKKSVWLF